VKGGIVKIWEIWNVLYELDGNRRGLCDKMSLHPNFSSRRTKDMVQP